MPAEETPREAGTAQAQGEPRAEPPVSRALHPEFLSVRTALLVLVLLILPGCQVPKVPLPPIAIQADVQPVDTVTLGADLPDAARLCVALTAGMQFDHPGLVGPRFCYGTVGEFRELTMRMRMAD